MQLGGGRPQGGHGGPAAGESERRGKASCPTASPSAALTTPLVSKGTALELGEWGAHKK